MTPGGVVAAASSLDNDNDDREWFTVMYSDGDSEDLYREQVEQMLVLEEPHEAAARTAEAEARTEHVQCVQPPPAPRLRPSHPPPALTPGLCPAGSGSEPSAPPVGRPEPATPRDPPGPGPQPKK